MCKFCKDHARIYARQSGCVSHWCPRIAQSCQATQTPRGVYERSFERTRGDWARTGGLDRRLVSGIAWAVFLALAREALVC